MARDDLDIIARFGIDATPLKVDFKKAAAEVGADAKSMGTAVAGGFAIIDRSAVEAVAAAQRVEKAVKQAGTSAAAQRAAYVNLGYQIQDISASLSSGVDPLRVFAQQSGQVAQALSGMGGKLGAVAGFLSGPWGAALTGAALVVAALASGLGDADDVAKSGEESLADLERQTDRSTAAEKLYREALGQTVLTQEEASKQAFMVADERRQAAQDTLNLARAELEYQKVMLQNRELRATTFGAASGTGDMQVGKALNDIRAAEKQISNLERALGNVGNAWERSLNRLIPSGMTLESIFSGVNENTKKAAKEAEKLAGKSADEIARRAKALDEEIRRTQQLVEIEGVKGTELEWQVALANQIADIEVRYAGLSADKIKVLKAATTELAEQKRLTQEIKDFEAGEKNAQRVAAAARKALEDQYREQAKIAERQFNNLADIYERAFRDGTGGIWDTFKSMGKRALAELAASWTLGSPLPKGSLLNSLFGGGGPSGQAGGLLDILGFGGGSTAAKSPVNAGGTFDVGRWWGGWSGVPTKGGGAAGAGGAGGIGAVAGPLVGSFALGSGIGSIQKSIGLGGSSLGGGIGAVAGAIVGGPIGAAIGAVIGSTLGGLIGGGAKSSGATLTSATGRATTGGKGGKQDQALGLAGSVQGGLLDIAEALGVDVGNFRTTIGIRGGDYRVNTSGDSLKIKNGAKDFGDDAEAAVEYALRDALNDGAFAGRISAAANNALKNTSKSIEEALQDALTIESIPKRLKAIEDPVGAALDDLYEEFSDLRDLLKENGASAAQLADAEKLYNYQRTEAMKQTQSTLMNFIDSLKVGSNSPLSVRDQLATAEAEFNAHAADIAAGKAIDQDEYVKDAQAYLELTRQKEGSTQGFFDVYNRVTATNAAAQSALTAASAGRTDANPFAKPTAEAAAATANNTAALIDTVAGLPAQIAETLSRLLGRDALRFGGLGYMRTT